MSEVVTGATDQPQQPAARRVADLVLEGGGVKGSALVGAVAAFEEAGYRFNRLAGTSAGAMVAALVAAGIPAPRLHELMLSVDFAALLDPTRIRALPLGRLGAALSELVGGGLYHGDILLGTIAAWLSDAGVKTFRDLAFDDPGADPNIPPEARYRVVMVASDISRELMVRIPWDLGAQYGIDAATFPVALAVRMSTAIPFFFMPVQIRSNLTRQQSYMVDGGLTSAFPVHIFDRSDGRPPRWPTFQVGLTTARRPTDRVPDLSGRLDILRAVVHTAMHGRLNQERTDITVADRTVAVDTSYVSSTEFTIDTAMRQRLFDDGFRAARAFLESFDDSAYAP